MKKTINMRPEFEWMGKEGILDSCGIIGHWLWEAEVLEVSPQDLPRHILNNYGFPVSPMKGGSFDKEVYKYPGDPDMYPMMTIIMNDGINVIHLYQYGMVAFFGGAESSPHSTKVMYRLD